jgi:hypothetical protein
MGTAAKPAGRKRKTPAKTPMRTPAHGNGRLRVGGTNKGGPGRPPEAFKELCRQLASGETTVEQVEKILQDQTHPQFIAALKWATEHGYGKPTEHVEHSGTVNHKHQVWKFGNKQVAF